MSVEIAVTDLTRSVVHGWLWDLADCDWSQEAADVGGLSVTVPARLEDVDRMRELLAIDQGWRVAEVRVRGEAIEAYVIESLTTERDDDGVLRWHIEGASMLRLWEGVPILGETTEENGAPVDERIFGPGSLSAFGDLVNWHGHKDLKRQGDSAMPGWDSLLWKPDAPRNGDYAVRERDLIDDGVAEEEAAERNGDYPDPDAWWIGPPSMSTKQSDMPFMAPPGTWWVRETFTLSRATDFILLITADEFYALFVDGQEMGSTTGDVYQWRSWDAYEFGLPPGRHTIAIRVEELLRPFAPELAHRAPEAHTDKAGCDRGVSYSWSSTAVLYSMWRIDDADDPPERLDDKQPWLRSGRTSPRVADIGQYTGWMPGEILWVLLDESEEEAICAGDVTMPPVNALARGFGLFQDSNGDPWTVRVDHAFSTMRSGGMEVIRKLAELGAEVTVDPTTRSIEAYNVRGEDRTEGVEQVALDRWRDLMSEQFELTAGPINSIRVRYRFGVQFVDEADSIARFGRMWQPLQLGDALSAAQARQGGRRALQEVADARETEPLTIPDGGDGPQPNRDFFVADVIWVRDSQGHRRRERVWTVGGSLRDDGAVEWQVEASDPLVLDQEARVARIRHGLRFGVDAKVRSFTPSPVDVEHGLRFGTTARLWSHAAPPEVAALHGMRFGNGGEAWVNDPPGAEVTIEESS